MFDFSISQNRGRRPTRRILASYIASCIFHFLIILTIINYPQLLRGGRYHRFRYLALIAEGLMSKPADDGKDWSTVTVLRPQSKMMTPSAATLKKYLYDWNKKGPGNGTPPIRIRFGDEQKAALNESLPPMPRVRQEPKSPQLSLPENALAAAIAAASSGDKSKPDQSADASGSSAILRGEPGAGKKETIILPPPGSPSRNEAAANVAPSAIPNGIKQPPDAAPTETLKVFESEQKAIRSSESGFFDTKGFPLGEYANIIKERIKGNWLIPSNLQSFQGHTTLVFYIDRDGRYANARIVTPSGNHSFDNAALMAVIESDPFPPLPKGFPGNHIGAKFVLSWNEP